MEAGALSVGQKVRIIKKGPLEGKSAVISGIYPTDDQNRACSDSKIILNFVLCSSGIIIVGLPDDYFLPHELLLEQ